MAANKKRVTVTGSGRTVMSGAKSLGLVPADERFEITVRLRPSTSLDSLKSSSADQDVLPGAVERNRSHDADAAVLPPRRRIVRIVQRHEQRTVGYSGDAARL